MGRSLDDYAAAIARLRFVRGEAHFDAARVRNRVESPASERGRNGTEDSVRLNGRLLRYMHTYAGRIVSPESSI